MKRFLALALAFLMLLCSCGPVSPGTDTVGTDGVSDTDAPDSTRAPDETTEPDETRAPDAPVEPGVDFTIPVSADTFVYDKDGDSSKNFGSSAELDIKSGDKGYIRYTYLKFDISSLVGNDDFTCIDLNLTLNWAQHDTGNPEFCQIELFDCSTDWDESKITYKSQPKAGESINTYGGIRDKKKYEFPITDYVRYALKNGKTEIGIMVKDATPETGMRMNFASKEGGAANAPGLSVYYGTKTDDGKFNALEYEISKKGLDALLGQNTVRELAVLEDTYVEGDSYASKILGKEKFLDFKAQQNTAHRLHRTVLLKFDISSIDKDFDGRVSLALNCIEIEINDANIYVGAYACDPEAWDEASVTFMSRPEGGEPIGSTTVNGKGALSIDITDYVKQAAARGDSIISILLEGDKSNARRLKFDSREASAGQPPKLIINEGALNFNTQLLFTDVNPWDKAMEDVSAWIEKWEDIKKRGDDGVKTTVYDSAEFSFKTDAAQAQHTDGNATKYTSFATRSIDTLKNYTEDKSEVARYDEYGGLMDESMKQEATGYFYTKKVGDRWWTIDPLGYPYYRTAVVTVGTGSPNQQTALKAKYGSYEKWAQATSERLYELGFNSVGAWSSTANLIKAEKPLSQAPNLYLMKNYAKDKGLDISKSGSTELVGGVLYAFDPEFETYAESSIKSQTAAYADSPYIYGWFSDNELPAGTGMLTSSLAFDTKDIRFVYSYATAWTFMYLRTGKADVSLNDVTDELAREYRAMVYDKYLSICEELLDMYAPHHMYIGSRFLRGVYEDEYVLKVAGRYLDVITFNYYNTWTADTKLMANIQKWADKPFAITEWYAKGMDVSAIDPRITNKSGAGWTVRTQKDRGAFYQNFALSLMQAKGCVGFDWFQYWDNDPDNLSADESNRNANKGIINNKLEEYTELTDIMADLNHQKYNLIAFFDAR